MYVQDKNVQQDTAEKIDFDSLLLEERQNLVGAFVWLLQQDKKQNPAHYQRNK